MRWFCDHLEKTQSWCLCCRLEEIIDRKNERIAQLETELAHLKEHLILPIETVGGTCAYCNCPPPGNKQHTFTT